MKTQIQWSNNETNKVWLHIYIYKLIPLKCFLFNSIRASLRGIMNRPGQLQLCNQWRQHTTDNDNEFSDIKDGKLWRDFQFQDGTLFLANRNDIALSLNIDWFNPYVHTQVLYI